MFGCEIGFAVCKMTELMGKERYGYISLGNCYAIYRYLYWFDFGFGLEKVAYGV